MSTNDRNLVKSTFSMVVLLALALGDGPASAALAADPAEPDRPPPPVHVDLPLADVPYNTAHGGRWPSMAQSLWLATDAYELLHTGLRYVVDPYTGSVAKRLAGYLLVAAVDLVTVELPPFLAWQHEEWHRAAMGRRGIDSFDDIYKFRLFAETVSVSHVRDADLIALKREHPAEQVRLSAAGIEGNQELVASIERVSFFEGTRGVHEIILPLLVAQNFLYMNTCATSEGDALTDQINVAEGADVPRRDFTGLDCTGWVYDLFTPDEPYADRGIHPSGVGIDRYRKLSHLPREARSYLSRQRWFSLANVLDPRLFGVRRFSRAGAAGGPPLFVNAAVRHLPTSFGYAFRGDVYLMRGDAKLLASVYAYGAGDRLSPGLDASLLRWPLPHALFLSARTALWLQPEGQRYHSGGISPGGLAGLRLGLRAGARVEPWIEIEGKSPGWVPGNVYLDANLSVRTGLSAWLL